MSDDSTEADGSETVEAATAESTADTAETAAGDADRERSRLRQFLNYGLLAGLLLLALVAAVGFYTAVSSAITTWVSDEWRPLFRAAFNLAVLFLAGAGIAWQARRVA